VEGDDGDAERRADGRHHRRSGDAEVRRHRSRSDVRHREVRGERAHAGHDVVRTGRAVRGEGGRGGDAAGVRDDGGARGEGAGRAGGGGGAGDADAGQRVVARVGHLGLQRGAEGGVDVRALRRTGHADDGGGGGGQIRQREVRGE